MKKALLSLLVGLSLLSFFLFKGNKGEEKPLVAEKVLICGICRNIHRAAKHLIPNAESLGARFEDYAVLIYENNSEDNTVELIEKWAKKNPKVVFQSEMVPLQELPKSRTEKIARARNKVLDMARDAKFNDYKYIIMVDLDFRKEWPIDEIVNSIELPLEWDAISANGFDKYKNMYWDRYALRFEKDPFGPEIFGEGWWLHKCPIYFDENQEELVANYSAFGGLAIYKRETLLKFNYSGTVTEDLAKYYQKIIASLPKENREIQKYLKKLNLQETKDIPIVFEVNAPSEHPADYEPVTCCEHVTLHASMALSGHGKFFINPKMVMHY